MLNPKIIDAQRNNNLGVFHLSHIDLDGYGAQFITKHVFSDITFCNSDYGKTINEKFSSLVSSATSHPGYKLFLITDLNLTADQASVFSSTLQKWFGDEAELLLLDHHKTGTDVALKYDWYRLDTERCATLQTFYAFSDILPESERVRLYSFANLVNIHDLWQEDEADFDKANLLSSVVFSIDLLPADLISVCFDYRMHMLDGVHELYAQGLSVREIEQALFDIKETFLLDRIEPECFSDPGKALQYKYNRLVFHIVKQWELPSFEINGLRGKLLYNLPATVFQQVSHFYLKELEDARFLVNLMRNGKLSFRSIGDADVSQIAKHYFGGGGHKNASGAKLNIPRLFDSQDQALREFLRKLA